MAACRNSDRYSWTGNSSFRTPGFQLIELVMVLVILGILAAVAAPRFANAIARRRAENSVGRAIADVKLAQKLAKAQSRSHRLRVVPGEDAYVLEMTTDGLTWTDVPHLDRSDRGYRVELADPPYEADVLATNDPDDLIFEFDGYGIAAGSAKMILQIGRIKKTIALQSGGTLLVTESERSAPVGGPPIELDPVDPGEGGFSALQN